MTLPTPAYSVTIATYPTGSLNLTSTHGELPDPNDRVVLLDELIFDWAAVEGRVPGEFEPSQLSFGVAALASADLEPLQTGTRLQLLIQMGTGPAGSLLFREFRITDVDIDLRPDRRRKVQARVTAVDGNADMRSRFPEPGVGRYSRPPALPWSRSIVEVANALGIQLFVPPDFSIQLASPIMPPLSTWPEASADEVFARLCNTFTASSAAWGDDRHLTLMPLDGDSPPTGWVDLVTQPDPSTAPPTVYEPHTTGPRYVLAPLDRKVSGAVGLPYRPVAAPPSLWSIELAPDAEATQAGIAIVDGCRIEAPATARRDRGSAFTVAVLEGTITTHDDDGVLVAEDGSTEVSGPLASVYGPISRTIPVFTVVRSTETADAGSPLERGRVRAAAARIASVFLSQPAELGAATQYDAFQIRVSSMDSIELARRVIVELTPRPPSLTVDSHQTSTAVMVVGVDSDLVPNGEVRGFATAGTLTIAGGRVAYEATIAPGDPELIAGLSHQLSDVLGAARLNNIDPTLTLADMALTRRF